MSKVYRIEHKTLPNQHFVSAKTLPTNLGVFSCFYKMDYGCRVADDDYNDMINQLMSGAAIDFDIRSPEIFEVCGFGSIEQLSRWFTIELLCFLVDIGLDLTIAEYEAPDEAILHGDDQVLVDSRLLTNRQVWMDL